MVIKRACASFAAVGAVKMEMVANFKPFIALDG
jgi:hypothetical protein